MFNVATTLQRNATSMRRWENSSQTCYQHIKSNFITELKNRFALLEVVIPEDIDIEGKGKKKTSIEHSSRQPWMYSVDPDILIHVWEKFSHHIDVAHAAASGHIEHL